MKRKSLFLAVLLIAALVHADGPRGTAPRESADKYPAHAAAADVSVGAQALKPKDAAKIFASNVNSCCVVVEVALYPQQDGSLKVSLDDFALRVSNTDVATKPSTPEVLAARLQKKADPSQQQQRTGIQVTPTGGVGYESGGIDPATGQRRPGGMVVHSGAEVSNYPSGPPKPASTDTDRRTMEQELGEKGLPEGYTSKPVSGYLYFALPEKDRKGQRRLEYTVNGNKMVVELQ